jgi:putative ABC transport system substrate-binding protein
MERSADRRTRRGFLRASLALAGLGLWSGCAPTPPAARRTPRLGFLSFGSSSPALATSLSALREGLQRLGYTEGRDIAIEERYAEGRAERLPDLAAELVGLPVDVIVTAGAPAAVAAKEATAAIPIVVAAQDPVGQGLVGNLARPEGNVTGFSLRVPGLNGKRLELFKEALPPLARAAALRSIADARQAELFWTELEDAARRLGVEIHRLEVASPDDFESAFAAGARARADGLVVSDDPLTFNHRRRIIDFAAQQRLPAVYDRREWAADGGLLAYGPSFTEPYRRAAGYVDRLLKGARPADLPVEQPTTFDLVLNLKTAQGLGLTIPQSVLAQATELIQ